MGVRGWDDGGSECSSVMEGRGVEPRGKITPRASEQTSIRYLITRKNEEPTEGAKQMMAVEALAGAASRCKANRPQASIVKVARSYRIL